jgi:dTDP-4-amino-4,6-dideoxygalactose transaminase
MPAGSSTQPEPPQPIPYSRAFCTDAEVGYVLESLATGHRHGDGPFTRRCHAWLEARTGCAATLLTTSCTTALEMAAVLAGVAPGDEVIMPSYTFVSTANAFVLRGATPVFVDIDAATQNLDPARIEAAITPRTKAIVPVHYAGVGCDMDALCGIARRHRLLVIEDAAQALLSTYKRRPLGSIGQFGAISFHDTKNTSCGEGGALLINDPRFVERARIIWEKGTNRQQMLRGEVAKYSWMDIGSSYLPSDVTAAFLLAQLEAADATVVSRRSVWRTYHSAFADAEQRGWVRRPFVPAECEHNGHIYYLILPSAERRSLFIERMKQRRIATPFHFVPLHGSPAGRRFGRAVGSLRATATAGSRLVRLPLWRDMPAETVSAVIEAAVAVLSEFGGARGARSVKRASVIRAASPPTPPISVSVDSDTASPPGDRASASP